MNQSRRSFLKNATIATAAMSITAPVAGLLDVAQAADARYTESDKAFQAKRWAMVIDTRRMADEALQRKVIEACHSYHNVPEIQGPQEVKWIWPERYQGSFTEQQTAYPPKEIAERKYLLLCNHCENPPCVRVCPTQATFKRPDGIVEMDYHRCIGCRFCMAGCPYGSRSFNFTDGLPHVKKVNPTYPARGRGVVEKCTFCSELLAKGELPRCVEASEGGILFGDLADSGSDVRRALAASSAIRRKPSLGTEPCVYYIL